MKTLTEQSTCEICGCGDSDSNPLMNWMRFKFEDKIVCRNCTSDDIDKTYRQIGFSESAIKALRKERDSQPPH